MIHMYFYSTSLCNQLKTRLKFGEPVIFSSDYNKKLPRGILLNQELTL